MAGSGYHLPRPHREPEHHRQDHQEPSQRGRPARRDAPAALRAAFKDEVRRVGRQLGIPDHLISRHPFPGPGLAVRILGDITREKVRILQDADDIFIQGLRDWKVTDEKGNETTLYHQVWQAGVILLPVQSVGVMGDERTYERAVALRAVTSTDAMTADWAHLPYEFLAKVSNDIINKVKGVNRVTYGGLCLSAVDAGNGRVQCTKQGFCESETLC